MDTDAPTFPPLSQIFQKDGQTAILTKGHIFLLLENTQQDSESTQQY